ncbi:DUF4465 domain-containing protein [Pirellulales bacterium]|nr:DUF4465 domain-containing protein [Pirellulales bacterium]
MRQQYSIAGWMSLLACGAALLGQAALAATITIDFEELPLVAGDFYNGSDQASGFTSRHTEFNNRYDDFGSDCCWNGWSYSQTTDATTPGAENQYSAYPGAGASGSPRYGIAFSGHDAGGGIIPEITLPSTVEPVSADVANSTYAALSMRDGDGFAKKFGGASGNDPDWFRLTIEGRNSNEELVGEVVFFLADFHFSDSADDFIRDDWTTVDLAPLAGLGVRKLAMRLTSTDAGPLGMNTPAYVALDNLVLDVTAEPGDFNLNGTIDGVDLAIWMEHFGATSSGDAATGDANDDGDVSGWDLLAWQRGYGETSVAIVLVPEPGAGAGALVIIVSLWCTCPLKRARRPAR